MDCLQVKLKGSVNNPLMPRLGELLFKVKFTSVTSVYWGNSEAGDRRIVGDGNFLDSNGNVIGKTAPYTTSVKMSAGEYYVGLPSKYTFSSLNPVMNIDTSELKYSTSTIPNGCTLSDGCTGSLADLYGLTKIILSGTNTISGSLTDLDLENLVEFSCHQLSSNNDLIIDIDDLADSTKLTTIRFHKRYNPSGSVESLAKCTKLTKIECQGGDALDINGDIETMVVGMLTNGRTSGTLIVQSTGAKLNNKTVSGYSTYNFKITFGSGTATITKADNTQIASYSSGSWSYS